MSDSPTPTVLSRMPRYWSPRRLPHPLGLFFQRNIISLLPIIVAMPDWMPTTPVSMVSPVTKNAIDKEQRNDSSATTSPFTINPHSAPKTWHGGELWGKLGGWKDMKRAA